MLIDTYLMNPRCIFLCSEEVRVLNRASQAAHKQHEHQVVLHIQHTLSSHACHANPPLASHGMRQRAHVLAQIATKREPELPQKHRQRVCRQRSRLDIHRHQELRQFALKRAKHLGSRTRRRGDAPIERLDCRARARAALLFLSLLARELRLEHELLLRRASGRRRDCRRRGGVGRPASAQVYFARRLEVAVKHRSHAMRDENNGGGMTA